MTAQNFATKKLTKTYLTSRPTSSAFVWSFVVLLVIGLCSQVYWYNIGDISKLLPASLSLVADGKEYWRLLTATLIHSDFEHFLSNGIFLFIFGYLIIGYFGLWIYPIFCFISSALINYLTIIALKPQTKLLGASGMLYMMVAFWLTLYFFIERKKSWGNRLLRIIGVFLVVFFPTSYRPEVSYRAHFIGAAVGIIFAVIYFYVQKSKLQSYEVWVTEEPEEIDLNKRIL